MRWGALGPSITLRRLSRGPQQTYRLPDMLQGGGVLSLHRRCLIFQETLGFLQLSPGSSDPVHFGRVARRLMFLLRSPAQNAPAHLLTALNGSQGVFKAGLRQQRAVSKSAGRRCGNMHVHKGRGGWRRGAQPPNAAESASITTAQSTTVWGETRPDVDRLLPNRLPYAAYCMQINVLRQHAILWIVRYAAFCRSERCAVRPGADRATVGHEAPAQALPIFNQSEVTAV